MWIVAHLSSEGILLCSCVSLLISRDFRAWSAPLVFRFRITDILSSRVANMLGWLVIWMPWSRVTDISWSVVTDVMLSSRTAAVTPP
jgi:hypothetical protein